MEVVGIVAIRGGRGLVVGGVIAVVRGRGCGRGSLM